MRGYRISIGRPVYLSHPASLGHDTGAHPDRAARIVAIERQLEAADWLGFDRRQASPVDRDLLEQIHDPGYVAALEKFCGAGGGELDIDTVASPGSWPAALHAAGGAVALVDALVDGGTPTGFVAARPPGHHAKSDRAMGFCLFNNVAVGAQAALTRHGLRRVLILDWDVHHGNGTNDIFHATDAVLYVSIHQSPLYPGTGMASDIGHGAGEGYTVNLPVPAGSGDPTFCSLVEHVVLPLARRYEPQLVLVSAGFDAHRDDTLAGCEVTDDGYAVMTGSLRRLCAELDVPLGVQLEGGYELAALARSVAATMTVLGADEPPPPLDDLGVDPLAAAALERLRATA